MSERECIDWTKDVRGAYEDIASEKAERAANRKFIGTVFAAAVATFTVVFALAYMGTL